MNNIKKIIPLSFLSFVLAMVCTVFAVRGQRTASVIVKGIASLGFVLAGIISFKCQSVINGHGKRNNRIYAYMIISGLILGMIGDIFLGLPGDMYFLMGVGAFGMGHIFYAAAFLYAARIHPVHIVVTLLVMAFTGIYMNFMPYIDTGSMLIPCNIYIVVIALMVGGAVSMKIHNANNAFSGWMCLTGSVFFYISDFILLHMLFGPAHGSDFANFANMITYYISQNIIALSLTGGLPDKALKE